ncbi:Os07g0489650, partial [Oryza sativa Japonica Group]
HLVGVAAFLLATVGSLVGKARDVLAADHLLLHLAAGEGEEVGLDHRVARAAAAAEAKHEVQRRLLLDVVVGQRPAVLQLLPGEDQPLLVRRDTFLVLDLGLDIVDGVAALDLEGDGLPRQGLHEDLHLAETW